MNAVIGHEGLVKKSSATDTLPQTALGIGTNYRPGTRSAFSARPPAEIVVAGGRAIAALAGSTSRRALRPPWTRLLLLRRRRGVDEIIAVQVVEAAPALGIEALHRRDHGLVDVEHEVVLIGDHLESSQRKGKELFA